jgi:hypothetical protein
MPASAKPNQPKCNRPRTRLNRVWILWKAAPTLRVSGLACGCSFVQTFNCSCSTLTSSAPLSPLGAYLPKTLPFSEQPSTPHRAVLVHQQGCGLWLALSSDSESTSHNQAVKQYSTLGTIIRARTTTRISPPDTAKGRKPPPLRNCDSEQSGDLTQTRFRLALFQHYLELHISFESLPPPMSCSPSGLTENHGGRCTFTRASHPRPIRF